MKKIIFSGFMGAILAGPALADGSSVTTKNYVDDGLRAVYSASKGYTDTAVAGVAGSVSTLNTQINGANGLAEQINGNGLTTFGLAGDVATLQQTIGDTSTPDTLAFKVNQLESSSTGYTPGDGIAIDTTNNNNTISVDAGAGVTFDANNKLTIDGLATTQASGNTTTMYVYKNGALVPMDVETTWDKNFDFDPQNP